jgi:hypothetical protein
MKRLLASLACLSLLWVACDHPTPTSTDPEPGAAGKPASPLGLSVAALKQPASTQLPDGRLAERRVHIFWRDGHGPSQNPAKGGNGGGNGGGGSGGGGNGGGKPGGGGSDCYSFIASGTRWKVAEDYMVDQSGGLEVTGAEVSAAIAQSAAAWNGEAGVAVFGSQIADAVDGADEVSTDGKNEVLFGAIDDPGVIAVTITWGIFGGPPRNRQLVEWDMVFNDPDFDWGDADVDANVMDLLNIAVHEVGHAGGMDHPDGACGEETMYAFAAIGETKKRTLNAGDIAGIQALYR